jgi:hypothetical protein
MRMRTHHAYRTHTTVLQENVTLDDEACDCIMTCLLSHITTPSRRLPFAASLRTLQTIISSSPAASSRHFPAIHAAMKPYTEIITTQSEFGAKIRTINIAGLSESEGVHACAVHVQAVNVLGSACAKAGSHLVPLLVPLAAVLCSNAQVCVSLGAHVGAEGVTSMRADCCTLNWTSQSDDSSSNLRGKDAGNMAGNISVERGPDLEMVLACNVKALQQLLSECVGSSEVTAQAVVSNKHTNSHIFVF